MGTTDRKRGAVRIRRSAQGRKLLFSLVGSDDVRERALAHRELALSNVTDDPAQAEKNMHTAIELFERSDQATEVAATYRVLGDLLQDQRGSRDAVCEAYRNGLLAVEADM